MRSILAIGAVTASSAATAPRSYHGYSFATFVEEFEKAYDEHEHGDRKSIFEQNLVEIMEHNARYVAGKESWFMAVNKFADWTEEELSHLMGSRGHKMPGALSSIRPLQKHELPATVDWRDQGVVTPVKDQGSCGSCWAFAATETVESAYAMATGTLLELAPQVYVSCMGNPDQCGGTGGCEGAIAELAFNYTVSNGIALASDYAYTASDSPCKAFSPAVKVGGYVTLPANDADALATAIATVGPVSVSVAASQFSRYGGGIFTGCTGSTGAVINHAVQAVGYSADYWLIRNSWGTGWGESGYIRLSRSKDSTLATDTAPADGFNCIPYPDSIQVAGECGVLSDSAYPTGAAAASATVV
jgi:cathepsin L